MKKILSIVLLFLIPLLLLASSDTALTKEVFPTVLNSQSTIELRKPIYLQKTNFLQSTALINEENCLLKKFNHKNIKEKNHKTCKHNNNNITALPSFKFFPTNNQETLKITKKRKAFKQSHVPSLVVTKAKTTLVFKAPKDSEGKKIQHIGTITDTAHTSTYIFHEGDYYIESLDIQSDDPKRNDLFTLKTKGKVRIFLNSESKIIKRAKKYQKRGYIELNYKKPSHHLTLFSKSNLTIDASRRFKIKGFIYGYEDITLVGNKNATYQGAVTSQGILSVGKEEAKHHKQEKSGTFIYDRKRVKKLDLGYVVEGEPVLKSLVLSMDKTDFIRKRNPYYKSYIRQQTLVTVIATYSDGHSEEVTDNVYWSGEGYGKGKVIRVSSTGHLWTWVGKATLIASLGDIKSNILNINVRNEEEGRLLDVKINNQHNTSSSNRDAEIRISLMEQSASDVVLKLTLKESDGVRFRSNNALSKEITYTREDNEYGHTINIKDVNHNNTQPFTIITELLDDNDIGDESKDPKDIVVSLKEDIKLFIPPLQERRGAIRGVTIAFNILSTYYGFNYTLVDAPMGMRIVEKSQISEFDEEQRGIEDGTIVEWKVPMDIEEKIHNITVRATDLENNITKEITFPIKVPKTKPIQTKIVNNELIVTDKSSNLYGMKMKGHNGEDISELRLRSVEYGDVWKHIPKQFEINKKLKYTAFIIDNKSPKLNIDFVDDSHLGFYRYSGGQILLKPWYDIQRRYRLNTDGTLTFLRNEYDSGGTKVYLMIIEEKEK